MGTQWLIRLFSASLLICWAFQIAIGEESALTEQYGAARAAYAEALRQYQATGSDSAAAELLGRAGELLIVGEGLYSIDDPQMLVLEAAYGYALVESKKYQAAQQYLGRALAGMEGSFGENAEELVNPMIALANAFGGSGETTRQIELYERAQTLIKERHGELSRERFNLDSIISEGALSHSNDPSILAFLDSSVSHVPIERVAPAYPARALAEGLEGYVDLMFTVTGEGKVKDPVVTKSSNKIFERPALRAVRKFVYPPRIFNGEPVDKLGVKTRISFFVDDGSLRKHDRPLVTPTDGV